MPSKICYLQSALALWAGSCALAETRSHAQAPIGWQVAAQSIEPPASVTGESWGYSIAFNEDASLLAVGAPNARALGASGVGKVYIYEREVDGSSVVSWTLAQTITAPPFETGDPEGPYAVVGFAQFGSSVALENDILVVGSWGWTGVGDPSFAGRAFVYTRDGGTFGSTVTSGLSTYDIPEAVLRPNDRVALDLFGYEVAIDFEGANGTIVVGKQLGEGPAEQSNAGSAYVFEGSGAAWTQVAKLTAGDSAAANDNFGEQIAVREGTVVVGCPKHDGPTGSTNSGTVFVFERPGGGWAGATVPTSTIRASDASPNDGFGASVDLIKDGSGTLIAIGAPGYDRDQAGDTFSGNGAAYVYTGSGTTWSLANRAFARESNPNNAFGFSVAATGSFNQPSLLVGSPGYEGGAVGSGVGFNVVGSGGSYALTDSDLWVPSSAAGSSLGRSVAHRRFIGAEVIIRAALGSEYPTLAPRIFVLDFSTSVPGPDYPTDKQIAAGVPPCPHSPGTGGWPSCSRTASDADSDGVPDVYDNCPTTPNPSQSDCDGDGSGDTCEIDSGAADLNADGIPDSCQCYGDVTGNQLVDGIDLAILISAWGGGGSGEFDADLDQDGVVDGRDLALLLSTWGTCASDP
jgi:hypothetical protein